ncbi:hypothetical protein BBF96_08205 [Anoxybacter fermentans]|uniref:Glycosyltransferase 2-like domain-containing protein n=1 Tax=Anoxybacter fermentans TaxID=1323375 RepID=A0A3S9SYD1_9FIRM|nr:TPR domain-containing glycosyltransferase [Anoxybacter fermentans]AZR73366.1 hypothetical protein BBF96_08205 [Anoxybacter fermentans]
MFTPNVSVCLIVKNEEKNLKRCLTSIQHLADEIIVVDTGSTDNTVKIAKEFKAKVFFFPWIEDFSAARNFAINQAQGSWIFFLDADEELKMVDKKYWQSLIQATDKEAYFVQIVNCGDGGKHHYIRNLALRFFKRKTGYYYKGRIHEQILPQILQTQPLSAIGTSRLEVIHYGYSADVVAEKAKIERNVKLLQLELKNNPKDPFMRFNLGIEYHRLGEFQIASWHFKTALELLNPNISYYPYLILRLGMSLIDAGDFYGSIKVLKDGCEEFPDYTDLYFFLGEIYFNSGFYEQAIEYFKKCLELGEAPEHYVSEVGVGSFRAALRLGECYEVKLKITQAIEFYYIGLKSNPSNYEILKKIIQLFIRYYSEEDFQKYFEDKLNFLESKEVEQVLYMTIDYFPDFVLQILQSEKALIQSRNKGFLLCKAFWNKNELKKCEESLSNVEQTEEVLLLKFQLYWYQGKWDQLRNFLVKIPESFPYPLKDVYLLLEGSKDLIKEAKDINYLKNISHVLYVMTKNWISIGFRTGIDAILKIYQQIPLKEAKLKLGKLLYKKKYYQDAIEQFLSINEDNLDSEGLKCLAEIASIGNDNVTAFQFINQALTKKDASLDTWITYLKIALRNVCDYSQKALIKFPENTKFNKIITLAKREVNKLDKSSIFISMHDCKE